MTVGERIGRYELVAQIATGGMGLIYLARTKGIGGFERHVVIKTLDLAGDDREQMTAMFLDEARVLGVLHHQHIAPVLEINEDDGRMYIAMEYIHGRTAMDVWLRTLDLGAALPVDFCLTVVSAAASGLHYAHTRRDSAGQPLNIVHRDVSLSNLMIGFDGAVKLIDFGIAKAANRRVETQTGFVKGKIGYMAPEQVRRQELDARTDVFALGIVLYELTTMTRAFREESDRMTLERIKSGAYRLPSEFIADYPKDLERIVARALRLDPRERFPDAESMRAAMEALGHKYDLLLGDAAVAEIMHQLFEDRREPWQRENPSRPETSLEVSLEVTNDTQSVPAIQQRKKPLRAATDVAAAHSRENHTWEAPRDATPVPAPPPKGAFDDDQKTAIAPTTIPKEAFNNDQVIVLGAPPKGVFDDEQATAISTLDPASAFATTEVPAIPEPTPTSDPVAEIAIADLKRRSADAPDPAARAAKIQRLFTESSFNPTETPAKPLDSLASPALAPAGRAGPTDDTEGLLDKPGRAIAHNIGETGEIDRIASIANTTDGVTILPASAVLAPKPEKPPKSAAAKAAGGSSRRIMWIALAAIAVGGLAIGIYMVLNREGGQPETPSIDAPHASIDAAIAAIDGTATTIDAAEAAVDANSATDAAKSSVDAAPAFDAAPGSRVITVKITSTPTGATVALDGLKRLGKTPFDSPVELPPGPHSIKVRMMGFNTVKIDIAADDKSVERDVAMIRIPPKKEEPKPDDEDEQPPNKSKLDLPD